MCQVKESHPSTSKGVFVLEQTANSITHGMFIPTSIYLLYKFCSLSKSDADLFNAWVYGIALIVLFGVSTLYHCSCLTEKTNLIEFLRISDHATIFLFIAASYTPWVTIAGYDIDATHYVIPLWSLAAFGIFFSFYTRALTHHGFELCMYIAEGLLPALFLIWQVGFRPELYDVAVGGFFFLSGIIFFRLDGTLPFAHAIWHIFVFLGTYYHSTALVELLIRNSKEFLHPHGV